MADQDRGSDDPRLAAAARHALHDEELIAAFAAGDIDDSAEAERARSVVQRCAMCRELHDDLLLVRGALQASGSAAQRAATRSAPRDFRLTAEDAARLRPGSPVARLGARLGWRDRLGVGIVAFGRPLGAGLATLGVAGLLIGSLVLSGSPMSLLAGAGASSAPAAEGTASAAEASNRAGATEPGETTRDTGLGVNAQSGGSSSAAGLLLFGGSAALLVVGVGLVIASRRGPQPISAGPGN
ncbi:MAG TPA: hypothetical protein VL749_01045 [Patescibacteria group bacterium]|nr:hypothetical protein [Patescibacteria group bacterium]